MKQIKYDGNNIEQVIELTGCHVELGKAGTAVIYTNDEVLICNVDATIIVNEGKVSLEG